MVERDRGWLRTFLHLDKRADMLTVPRADVERQEDTVLRALEMLEAQPGVVLADEVGMGKTYEALGVIAARHHADSKRRTLILTPGPDLNTKWTKELRAFCDPRLPTYRGFEDQFVAASSLQELVARRTEKPILVAPITMFQGARAKEHNRYLLSLFFEWRKEHGHTTNAAFRRYKGGALERIDVKSASFLDAVSWEVVKPLLDDIFKGKHGRTESALERGFREEGLAYFDSNAVDDALAELRFRLVGALVPDLDLLVVDEAHKLKNAASLRALAVREVFDRRFEKALFLTATPFQLDVSELRQVLNLFQLARSAPPNLRERADALLTDIGEYKDAYREFETAWRRLETGSEFQALFESDESLASARPDDPNLARVVDRARRLLDLKRQKVEPAFRSWMIRSLREDKRTYREHQRRKLRPEGGASLPFLVYERFIAELFRSKARTHKAAVQINMVSSYEAARTGALLAEELRSGLGPDAEAYRSVLRKVLGGMRDDRNDHPKLSHVVADALNAAAAGEKTLIFCARTESLRELARRLKEAWEAQVLQRWQRGFPDITADDVFGTVERGERRGRGLHESLRDRLHRTDSVLYLALRERYVSEPSPGTWDHVAIAALATSILREQGTGRSRADSFDWALAKRCIEQAAARLHADEVGEDAYMLERLLSPEFVRKGVDWIIDGLEPDEAGPHAPTWSIEPAHVAQVLLPTLGLWSRQQSHLLHIPSGRRVQTVERIARYLTTRDVPFLADVAFEAHSHGLDVRSAEPSKVLEFMDAFWRSGTGSAWSKLIGGFLAHLDHQDDERKDELLSSLDTEKRLAFCRHTADGDTRERLREAFNTPLFPMVLIANEVMQEGLDLHHQCARVVHHDLAWNPAQLEQRVGRVDRLGALIQRRRAKEKDRDAKLAVLYPLIERTIDIRLDRTVRAREKWLEFLLGAAPDFDEYNLADEPINDLPQRFADALRVDLGPRGPS